MKESRDINDLDAVLKEAFLYGKSEYDNLGDEFEPFLTCTHRPNEVQAKLYAKGRTEAGKIVTYAKPGQSKHNQKPSKAFDIAFKKGTQLSWDASKFRKFAEIITAKYPQVVWGGNFKSFKDLPHFEIK
ncbi:MAG: M15 family metallopeptidase [Bacteroidetes bacterium]|nr:M15 family metallopeptidase [Bacteroidota bacterium]